MYIKDQIKVETDIQHRENIKNWTTDTEEIALPKPDLPTVRDYQSAMILA